MRAELSRAVGMPLAGLERDVVTFGNSPSGPLVFVPSEARGKLGLSLSVRCANDPDVLAGPLTDWSFQLGLTPAKREACAQVRHSRAAAPRQNAAHADPPNHSCRSLLTTDSRTAVMVSVSAARRGLCGDL